MKTKIIAASAIAALLLVGVAAVAFAHSGILGPTSNAKVLGAHNGTLLDNQASSQNGNKTDTQDDNQTASEDDNQTASQHDANQSDSGGDHENEGGLNLTVGQTLTFTGLTGHFNNLTSQSSETEHDDNSAAGNATGAFTFQVTSVSADGANLTITSGSFTFNNTTYTVTSGTVTLGEGDRSGDGSGNASGGATFTVQVDGIHGNLSASTLDAHFKLDVKVGTSEYHVLLGTPQAPEDAQDD